jgi:hypothetical protein
MTPLERVLIVAACVSVLLRDSYPTLCDAWDFMCYTGFPAQVWAQLGRLFH